MSVCQCMLSAYIYVVKTVNIHIFAYIWDTYINNYKKEAMNLNESKEGDMRGIGGRKGKGEMI